MNHRPCDRCGEAHFPSQPVFDGVYLCADCWTWLGGLGPEAVIVDTRSAWAIAPALDDVAAIHDKCKLMVDGARRWKRQQAAEAKAKRLTP